MSSYTFPAVIDAPKEIIITEEQTALVKRTVAAEATEAELELYFYDCKRRGVHPLDKLLHFTKRSGKYTPVTSIDLFRMRAAETQAHTGTDEPVYAGAPMSPHFSATVKVYKMVGGESRCFAATARWAEYFPGDSVGFMWKKMPHLMLGKCAEALALRKAFPQQLHGLYINEEMDQADKPGTALPPRSAPRPVASSAPPDPPSEDHDDHMVAEYDVWPSSCPYPEDDITITFGKMAGKRLSECDEGYLLWLKAAKEKDLADPKKQRFAADAQAMLDHVDVILAWKQHGT